ELEIGSERELADYLRGKGLLLTSAEAVGQDEKKTNKAMGLPFLNRVKMVEKVFFTQNLQVMVKAGISVSVALKTLAQQTTNKTFQTILMDLYQRVDKGNPLADSLALYPKVFPELFVNMVRAGEKSGKLEDVLSQLTIQLRKSHALIAKVRGALTYPVIVVFAMVGIGIAMIVLVIPKITGIFEEVSATLPLPTRILIGLSDFVIHNGILLSGAVLIAAGLFVKLIHTGRGRFLWHGLLLKLPIMAPILRKINLAKFARTFSSLIKTEIPIVQAFEITASTLGNAHYRQAIQEAAERVKKGVQIASILSEHPKLFPPLIVQMVSVGEETGTIDTILEELAIFYEEDVDRTMSNLTTILEPVLILMLGLGVGALAVSIILPIYTLTQAV
ncbi:MAG: type II secretion system F family protein, partial [Candidatus Veblenbacteria bacterium]|nr:type II secretion system F family protein [Candidatus Veblenbacteria bacterium]